MQYHMRLPRNKWEFCLFMAVISVISVNTIAPVISYRPAEWVTARFLKEGDSYNAHILVNILSTVCMMSVILTIIAPWIVAGHVSLEPIEHFFLRWPRNFAVSFAVEALVAQPIARVVMNRLHLSLDARAERTDAAWASA